MSVGLLAAKELSTSAGRHIHGELQGEHEEKVCPILEIYNKSQPSFRIELIS